MICISETWLSSLIYNNEILHSNFNIYRCDRRSRGGGVMIAVCHSVPSRLVLCSGCVEFVAVELLVSPKIFLCCIYIPPACDDEYIVNSLSVLNSLPDNANLIVCGDFNAPNVNWNTLSAATPYGVKLCDVVYNKNLVQLVEEPTHSHGNILDLILSNSLEIVSHVCVDSKTCSALSDHYLITFKVPIVKPSSKSKSLECEFFNFCKGDYLAMDEYLLDEDIATIGDVELFWNLLKAKIFDACHLFIPKLRILRHYNPRWFNKEIRHLLNSSHTLKRLIKKKPTTYKLAKLSQMESHLQELILSAKLSYVDKLVSSFFSEPKKLFKYIRYLTQSSLMPQCLFYESVAIRDPGDKADAFNKFFHSTFTHSDFVLPPMSEMPTPSSQISIIEISSSDVMEAITKLDPSKAFGSDGLSPMVLKGCCTSLLEPITSLLQMCIKTCIIPKEWKIHKICPVPKSGDLSKVENYRPISLLCILSKILESIIYNKIISFIRPLISQKQFGFLKKSSCLMQLLTSFNQVYTAVDDKKDCEVIFLDFRKAFDSVPHQELLWKLWYMGITGPLWFWFRNYLTEREHFVSIDGKASELLPVISGVPQGSILGPLLFLIYVNDLPAAISYSSIYMFADDTKLIAPFAPGHGSLELQEDLLALQEWCRKWKLQLNIKKCVAILFSLAKHQHSDFTISDSVISNSNSHRDLGVVVCGNLSWLQHYNKICANCYQALHLMRRSLPVTAPVSLKRNLYLCLVRSHLAYCSQLWCPRFLKDISMLERIQRRASKFILNDFTSDYKTRLVNLNLLPLMYWLELQDLLFLIKSMKEPSENFNIFQYVKFGTSTTRASSSHHLVHQYHRTSHSSHFYFSRIVRLWNSLQPLDISVSLHLIKSNIKSCLWNHFITNFNSNNVCSFHVVCPCPKCSLPSVT